MLVVATLIALVAALTTTMAPARAAEQSNGTFDVEVTAQPMASSDHFELRFRNYYRSTVNVALMYPDFSGGCDDYGGWATEGWWQVARGQTVHVLNTTNRNVYFYAYAGDGTTWTGNDSSMLVKTNAQFNSCVDIDSTGWQQVGLRKIDMGSAFSTYTLNLRR